jgi:hypothetical protein
MLKNVINYENIYEISDDGVVYSKERYVGHSSGLPRLVKRKEVSQAIENGRRRVTLFKNGERKRFFVHRLVMQAFVGECPDGMEVCHNDGNPSNNKVKNLRYDTRVNNAADSARHGTRLNGSKNHNTKLSAESVLQIRKLQGTQTQENLASVFGVSQGAISRVILGKTWRHV